MCESAPVLIIDYRMGNLRSVANAFAAIGYEPLISDNPEDLGRAERIVLPGVGAFGDGMSNLRSRGWIEALEEEVRRKGKPFLGLCLGMQLLATTGTEHSINAGLGWIPGTVERIRGDDPAVRVPHIGWDDVHSVNGGRLYAGLNDGQTFYFVHSYVFHPNDSSVISGTCSYGGDFAASVEMANIWATQYHPEKSQKAGLAVLRNFAESAC